MWNASMLIKTFAEENLIVMIISIFSSLSTVLFIFLEILWTCHAYAIIGMIDQEITELNSGGGGGR